MVCVMPLPDVDFLTRQLIAYIGNKRRLLDGLDEAFSIVEAEAPVSTFLDPFAGSGAVSRLAKYRGYRVFANDWEPFSFVVTAAHLVTDPAGYRALFRRHGGADRLFAELGAPTPTRPGPVCRHYAPESTCFADHRTERLYYTRENAEFIDTVRSRIEERYPGWDLEAVELQEKIIVLSSLVYEAVTHANTSGVFKAFHKGFGGYGADALGRILAPMELEQPVLCEGRRASVSCEDAAACSARHPVDLCYLDPPYNQHQYGSNYHLLNTVVFGDDPPIDESSPKSGIRSDWTKTRSEFCSPRTVERAFRNLFASIDARFLVVSYNTEGTFPLEALRSMLAEEGSVRVLTKSYTKYRGGRQSLNRTHRNQEIIFLLDRRRRMRESQASDLQRKIEARDVLALLQRPMHPVRAAERFQVIGTTVRLLPAGGGRKAFDLPLRCLPLSRPLPIGLDAESLSDLDVVALRGRLAEAACRDRLEEAELLLELLEAGGDGVEGVRKRAVRELFDAMKKFAFGKYRDRFESFFELVSRAVAERPERFPGGAEALRRLEEIAKRRRLFVSASGAAEEVSWK
jgi:adenine-specific DNA-methyltransferase